MVREKSSLCSDWGYNFCTLKCLLSLTFYVYNNINLKKGKKVLKKTFCNKNQIVLLCRYRDIILWYHTLKILGNNLDIIFAINNSIYCKRAKKDCYCNSTSIRIMSEKLNFYVWYVLWLSQVQFLLQFLETCHFYNFYNLDCNFQMKLHCCYYVY